MGTRMQRSALGVRALEDTQDLPSVQPREPEHTDARFENMIMRYEEPSSMVRWDSPLFTLPWDEDAPLEDVWVAVTKGYIKPANSAVNIVRDT